MQQRTGSVAGFYKAQFESAQDLTSASMEGFERIQQLAVQAWRQQLDNQLRLVNSVASRSAEAISDPELARPALDRMIDVQRQLADTVVRTNQRVLSAVTNSAQRTAEQGAALSANGDAAADGDGYTAMMQTALQQWQELTNRMLDVMQQQISTATDELQRQGERAAGQTQEAIQAGLKGLQSGANQAEHVQQAGKQERAQTKGERKHEMAG
jgi:hypothetical protein